MAIFFKFNSWNEKNFDSIPLDSSSAFMSVGELKQNIIRKKKLDKNTGLLLSNAHTGEEFKEDIEYVPKNTSIIVKVVPTYSQPTAPTSAATIPKIAPRLTPLVSTSSTTSIPAPKFTRSAEDDDFGPALWENPPSAIPDAAPASASAPRQGTSGYNEQDKILSIVNSAADYSVAPQGPTSMNKVLHVAPVSMGTSSTASLRQPAVAIQKKIPPPGYVCYRCGNAGHYIYDCPTNGDPTFNFQRKPQTQHGVPKTFLNATGIRPNETEFEKLLHQTGLTQEQWKLQNANIPKELICPICHKMMNNAVMLPCCGESACDDCVRGTLIDTSNFQCPLCKSPLVPDELVPNKALRRAVETFTQTGGHTGGTPPISPTFPAMAPVSGSTPPLPTAVRSPPVPASGTPSIETSGATSNPPQNKEALAATELRVSGTETTNSSAQPGTAETSSTNATGIDDKKKSQQYPDDMATYYPGMQYTYPMMYVEPCNHSNTQFRYNPMMNWAPSMPMSKDQFLAEQEKMRRMAEDYYRDPRYFAEYYGYGEMPYGGRDYHRDRDRDRRDRDRDRKRSRSRDRSRRSRSRDKDRHRRRSSSRDRDRDRKRSKSRDRDRKRSNSRDREDRKRRREESDKNESKSSDSKSTESKNAESKSSSVTKAPEGTATPLEVTPTTTAPMVTPATTSTTPMEVEQPKADSSSSVPKDDKESKREKDKESRDKDREREKDKSRDDKDRDYKRHKEEDKKHSSSHRSKDKKDKDRDRDRDRERDKKDKKDKEREREKEKEREREKDKKREREKEKDREKEKEREKEKDKERQKRKEKEEKDNKDRKSTSSSSSKHH